MEEDNDNVFNEIDLLLEDSSNVFLNRKNSNTNSNIIQKTNLPAIQEHDDLEIKDTFESSGLTQSDEFIEFIYTINSSLEEDNITTLKQSRLENYSGNNSNNNSSNIYLLISKCHEYISILNEDIHILSKQIKDIYEKRFPELETLVHSTYEYVMTVKYLGNSLELKNSELQSLLPNHTIMAINMISSTTKGNYLDDYNLNLVIRKCNDVISIHDSLNKLISFIESKMTIIAPNVTALVGSAICAKLVVAAGGIKGLSVMPASNILVLGSKNVNLNGLSTQGKLHKGFLSEMEFVKNQPDNFKSKALRKISNKCALAARCDAFSNINIGVVNSSKNNNINTKRSNEEYESEKKVTNSLSNIIKSNEEHNLYGESFFDDDENNNNINDNNNSITLIEDQEQENNMSLNKNKNKGEQFKEYIEDKLDKMKNYRKPIYNKPLPRPDDQPKKKRGGARQRKIKKLTEITEIRKQKNRLKFGEEGEIEYKETGKGYGMLGADSIHNKIRLGNKDTKKLQRINTKKNKLALLEVEKNKNNYDDFGNYNNESGMKSTITLSHNQGISLINPALYGRNSSNNFNQNNSNNQRLLFEKNSNFNNINSNVVGTNNDNKYFSMESGFSTIINKNAHKKNNISSNNQTSRKKMFDEI